MREKIRISAIILAAGAATRFGSPKQLLPVAGQPLLARVVDATLASSVQEVIVVLGYQAQKIGQVLAGRPVRLVVNHHWQEGMASSLRVGLAAVDPQATAAMIILGDQIRLQAREIDAVAQAYRAALARNVCLLEPEQASRGTGQEEDTTGFAPMTPALPQGMAGYGISPLIVVPTYQGRRGHPVLFDRALFPELASLQGDEGGRSLLSRYAHRVLTLEMATDGVVADVDTPEAFPVAGALPIQ